MKKLVLFAVCVLAAGWTGQGGEPPATLPPGITGEISVRSTSGLLAGVAAATEAATRDTVRPISADMVRTLSKIYAPFLEPLWERDLELHVFLRGGGGPGRAGVIFASGIGMDAFRDLLTEQKIRFTMEEDGVRIALLLPGFGSLVAAAEGDWLIAAAGYDDLARARSWLADGWRPRHWSNHMISFDQRTGDGWWRPYPWLNFALEKLDRADAWLRDECPAMEEGVRDALLRVLGDLERLYIVEVDGVWGNFVEASVDGENVHLGVAFAPASGSVLAAVAACGEPLAAPRHSGKGFFGMTWMGMGGVDSDLHRRVADMAGSALRDVAPERAGDLADAWEAYIALCSGSVVQDVVLRNGGLFIVSRRETGDPERALAAFGRLVTLFRDTVDGALGESKGNAMTMRSLRTPGGASYLRFEYSEKRDGEPKAPGLVTVAGDGCLVTINGIVGEKDIEEILAGGWERAAASVSGSGAAGEKAVVVGYAEVDRLLFALLELGAEKEAVEGEPTLARIGKKIFEEIEPKLRLTHVPLRFALRGDGSRVVAEAYAPTAAINAALYNNHLLTAALAEARQQEERASGISDPHDDARDVLENVWPSAEAGAAGVGEPDAGADAVSIVPVVGDPAAELIPYPHAGRWGFVNASGGVAVPFRFEHAKPFAAFGLAPVRSGGRWGFVDVSGDTALDFVYEDAGGFAANGLAPVKSGGKWGYIDREGTVVIPFAYDEASAFADNGLARVRDGGNGRVFITHRGLVVGRTPILRFAANGLARVNDAQPYPQDRWGYIDRNLELVISMRFEDARDFDDSGIAVVRMGGKAGCIDTSGEVIVSCVYDGIGTFDENGLASVRRDHKHGYIDRGGKVVIPLEHDDTIGFFKDGYVGLKKGSLWGMFDRSGRQVLPFRFERVGGRVDEAGMIWVRAGGKTGYMNTDGEVAVPLEYDSLSPFNADGLAAAQKGDRAGFIDRRGEAVIPFRFEKASGFGANGLAAVKENGKAGYVNARGETVIPFRFDDAEGFRGDLAKVKIDGKTGCVDERGELVVPCRYDMIMNFDSGGWSKARRDGMCGIVDREGNEVLPFVFPDLTGFSCNNNAIRDAALRSISREEYGDADEALADALASPYRDLFKVREARTRLEGYVDAGLNPVIPQRYTTIGDINSHGWAEANLDGRRYLVHVDGWVVAIDHSSIRRRVQLPDDSRLRVIRDGKYGYVDGRGAAVIPPQYEQAWDFQPNGLALVLDHGQIRCIDRSGHPVTPSIPSTHPLQ